MNSNVFTFQVYEAYDTLRDTVPVGCEEDRPDPDCNGKPVAQFMYVALDSIPLRVTYDARLKRVSVR